ncbi:MAG TPA: hypothetical protein VH438_11890 [Gemmatimonadales bacterium]|jgi:hypothetical protein
MIPMLLALGFIADTLRVRTAARAPVFDGRATAEEWGTPSSLIQRPGGIVRLWLVRWQESVYLAAEVEDSTYYWGDDLVISLDTRGDASPAPDHDDFQWYFRRMIDSSVVFRGQGGKWQPPRGDPDWRLGKDREGGGWEVRTENGPGGWSLELKLDPAYFHEAKAGSLPRMAFRVFDDSPQGWFIWPQATAAVQPTMLERRPDWWAPVQLEGGY